MRLHRIVLFALIGNAVAAAIGGRAKETDCSATPSLCTTDQSSASSSSSSSSTSSSYNSFIHLSVLFDKSHKSRKPTSSRISTYPTPSSLIIPYILERGPDRSSSQ